jgi:hypothetical protein
LPSKGNKEKEKKKNKEKKKKSKTTPIHEVGEPDGEQEETTLHDKEDVASAHGEKQLEIEVLYFSICHLDTLKVRIFPSCRKQIFHYLFFA